jgi:hypothetical protein
VWGAQCVWGGGVERHGARHAKLPIHMHQNPTCDQSGCSLKQLAWQGPPPPLPSPLSHTRTHTPASLWQRPGSLTHMAPSFVSHSSTFSRAALARSLSGDVSRRATNSQNRPTSRDFLSGTWAPLALALGPGGATSTGGAGCFGTETGTRVGGSTGSPTTAHGTSANTGA